MSVDTMIIRAPRDTDPGLVAPPLEVAPVATHSVAATIVRLKLILVVHAFIYRRRASPSHHEERGVAKNKNQAEQKEKEDQCSRFGP